jgi:regulator of RNase E activity RraB
MNMVEPEEMDKHFQFQEHQLLTLEAVVEVEEMQVGLEVQEVVELDQLVGQPLLVLQILVEEEEQQEIVDFPLEQVAQASS